MDGSIGARCTEDGEAFIAGRNAPQPLKMFLLHRDSAPGQIPMVLIMELSRLCGITGEKNNIILSHILSQYPTDQIERYLKRQGIPFDPVPREGNTVNDIEPGEAVESTPREATKGSTPEPGEAIPFNPVPRAEITVGEMESREAVDSTLQETTKDGTLEPRQTIDPVQSPPNSPPWASSQDSSKDEEAPFLLTVSGADEADRGKRAANF